MLQNVGTSERIARFLIAAGLGLGLAAARLWSSTPLPVWAVVVVGVSAVGLAFTALSGSCLMNRMLGRNTCAVPR